MKTEAQRIAIAEACPPKMYGKPTIGEDYDDGKLIWSNGWGDNEPVPDYPNDLNAMHEAEKVLDDEQFDDQYVVELGRLFFPKGKGPWKWSECPTMIVRATAAQRAEAFLKTLDKWQD